MLEEDMRLLRIITRRWKTVAVAGCLPLFCVIWLICGNVIENFVHQHPFNTDLWKNQRRSEYNDAWPPRLCMVDDLLASGRLNGMTESQVIELLGPPDSKRLGLSYYLGPERGFIRIDSETLIVEFGADGKVVRPRIYRD